MDFSTPNILSYAEFLKLVRTYVDFLERHNETSKIDDIITSLKKPTNVFPRELERMLAIMARCRFYETPLRPKFTKRADYKFVNINFRAF
jgi:hypothetical protein